MRIALDDIAPIRIARGEKDDRHGTRPLANAHHASDVESGHARHHDVEQHHGELVDKKLLECLFARVRQTTIDSPSGSSTASTAWRFAGLSSTTRILAANSRLSEVLSVNATPLPESACNK